MTDSSYDFPVYICPARKCRAVVTIDPNMWEEPFRCPRCGADLMEEETRD